MRLFDIHEDAGVAMSAKTSKIMVGTKYALLNEKLEDLIERVDGIEKRWTDAMDKFNDNEEWHEDFINRYGKFDKFDKLIDDVIERITNIDQKVLPEYIKSTQESLQRYGDTIKKIEETVVSFANGNGLNENPKVQQVEEAISQLSDRFNKYVEQEKKRQQTEIAKKEQENIRAEQEKAKEEQGSAVAEKVEQP